MFESETHAVTGAFGYTGRYIAQRLLQRGVHIHALTNSVKRVNSLGKQVKVYPFNFDQPELLTNSLRGVKVLYNTYWVRFNHKLFTHEDAVANTEVLFESAKRAGVERLVHISITNPSVESPLEYFSCKAKLETALIRSGMSYAILRPAVIFGAEDILINNIAWMLRKFPVMGVFGDGQYRLQPIYVEDLADLAVREGSSRENITVDAIGPETFSYKQLVKTIGEIIGKKRPIVRVGPGFGYWIARVLGWIVGDVILTRGEIEGLMTELLYTESSAVGTTCLTEWIRQNRDQIGRKYSHELKRRTNRQTSYSDL